MVTKIQVVVDGDQKKNSKKKKLMLYKIYRYDMMGALGRL